MAGKATTIVLTEQERNELEVWVRKPTMERRCADRARIVLEAAAGKTTLEIAHSLKVDRSTVSTWRTRFARQHMDGLMDKPRRGAKVKYGEDMERRILKQLDAPLPSGHSTWTGNLVAQALGDVTASHVWRVLRKHGVHLQRRRSWCISTDPQFTQKAADVMNQTVALYPDKELHVVLDNLNTHKPKHDRWQARHPNVHFHYIPTHASWLNQVEVWFSILSRQALRGLNATSVKDICRAIDAFTDSRNEHPFPFEWTKSIVNPVNLNHQLANLCN